MVYGSHTSLDQQLTALLVLDNPYTLSKLEPMLNALQHVSSSDQESLTQLGSAVFPRRRSFDVQEWWGFLEKFQSLAVVIGSHRITPEDGGRGSMSPREVTGKHDLRLEVTEGQLHFLFSAIESRVTSWLSRVIMPPGRKCKERAIK
jgi:hypothetical protein